MSEFITPVGRLVQGSVTLQVQNDLDTGQPKLDDQGNPVKECFLAVAFRKDDPDFGAFWGQMVATAKADFPHLFDAAGNMTHPKFAWKLKDGDANDSNGKPLSDKPGFAGHYIISMATRYLPRCFHAGKYDPSQQIQNAEEVIKRGYYIRVGGTMRGNGVTPQERTRVPGLFISPNLVELVAYGEEITSGPDAAKVFGNAPAPKLPPGASATPLAPPGAAPAGGAPAGLPGAGTPAPAPVALPGVATPAPAPVALPMPGAATPTPAGPPMPGAPSPGPLPLPTPAAPSYQMTASAMGATREQLIALGWTDEKLIEAGHMIKVG